MHRGGGPEIRQAWDPHIYPQGPLPGRHKVSPPPNLDQVGKALLLPMAEAPAPCLTTLIDLSPLGAPEVLTSQGHSSGQSWDMAMSMTSEPDSLGLCWLPQLLASLPPSDSSLTLSAPSLLS